MPALDGSAREPRGTFLRPPHLIGVRFLAASIVLATVALAAAGAPLEAQSTLEVQAILPLSGSNSFAGKEQAAALQILEQVVNRGGGIDHQPLHFVIHDSESSPQIAVQLFDQYVAGHVPLFIGDSSNATCSAIAAQVQGAGPVQFCLSPGLQTRPDGYSYALGHQTSEIAEGVETYLRARHLRKVALIVATDATGLQMDDYWTKAFAQASSHGLTLVAKERFNPTDLSVASQIASIKAAGAQALIAYISGAPFGTVLHSLQDSGLSIPVITSQGNLSYAFLDQYKALLPKTLLFVSGPLPAAGVVSNGPSKAVQETYLAAFRAAGVQPDFGHAVAWDSGTYDRRAPHRWPSPTADQIRGST